MKFNGSLALGRVGVRISTLFIAYALLTGTALGNISNAAEHIPQQKYSLGNTQVTTYHNDNMHSGQDLSEVKLNTSNVNVNSFGKRVSYPVDGQIYAQPLFMPSMPIGKSVYNVVYVATENDSVYAFDADQPMTAPPLWHTNFTNPAAGITAVPAPEVYSKYVGQDLHPIIGITSTPVIDPASGTLYVVAATKENGAYIQRLHALDLISGKDKIGSPLQIQASVPGTGYDSVKGQITFHAKTQNQRSALTLLHGTIYICWGAFGDTDPYHGWIMGYTYDGSKFLQVNAGVYNDTPNGQEAGIWMGGAGVVADNDGNVYTATGNGSFDLNTGGANAGDSYVKLSTKNGLHMTDYFTPFNQSCLDGRDNDLASGGPLLLPDQPGKHPHLMIGVGKEGRIYLIDRDNMGHYVKDANLTCESVEEYRTDVDHVLQELQPQTTGGLFGSMAYWSGTADSGPYIYIGGFNDHLRIFRLSNGLLSPKSISQSPEVFGFSGATPSISSDGAKQGTGIVWAIGPSVCNFPGCDPVGPGSLHAYDATHLSHELYNSELNPGRDRVDSYIKFSVPTIANGRVFVGTHTSLDVYGLLDSPQQATPTPTR